VMLIHPLLLLGQLARLDSWRERRILAVAILCGRLPCLADAAVTSRVDPLPPSNCTPPVITSGPSERGGLAQM
jgi:hypothetical protein